MKIGIDIRNISKKRTGDEVVFFNLAKNLARLDAQNEYQLFTDIIDPSTLESIAAELEITQEKNFKIVPIATKNKFTWNAWTLPQYLRKNPVDIYLTQYITPFFVPKKTRIATIIHDVSWNVYPQYIKFSDWFFLRILIPLSFRRADKIIGVSKFTAEEIIKYYAVAPGKVSWIHNAVGDNFQPEISRDAIDAVRKKYVLPEKFILYVGTLQPRKNLPVLIEAYAKLPTAVRSGIKLVLAGGRGHNYDAGIDEAIKKYFLQDDVFLPGFIDENDKPALFKASFIFCNPSFYEGFGITVLEAMSLAIPVAASKIPPHTEVAENSVLFFNPSNSDDLAEKLDLLCLDDNLRLDLSQKEARQAQNFSWSQTAQKVLAIFQKIA